MQFWEVLITIMLVYTATFTPYQVAFIESNDFWFIWDIVVDGIFLTDLVINFFTAYFDNEDNLIVTHKQIVIHYTTR